jgi:hypothetical protein
MGADVQTDTAKAICELEGAFRWGSAKTGLRHDCIFG